MTKRIICIHLVLLLFAVLKLSAQTITTNNLTQTSFCAGGNIIVQYSSSGSFPMGCIFYAELSDATGNFSNPTVMGSVPLNTGVIAGTIPSTTPFGINYRVRVTASNPYTVGTISSTPVIITSTAVSATILANPGNQGCAGDTILLWASFNESYFWSTGETTQSIHVTQSGTYTVTVTNYLTGCEVTSEPVNVTIHPGPPLNLGSDQSLCEGDSLILSAGAGYAQYFWNDSTSGTELTACESGIYSVGVTDTFGCSATDTIALTFNPLPALDLGSDTSLCGSEYMLYACPGMMAYNWNNGLSYNPALLVTESGAYSVMVTDSALCVSRDTIMMGIHPPPVLELGHDLSLCGTYLVLDGGNGYLSYNWNQGNGSGQFFTVTQSGIYTLVITDSSGCQAGDSIQVTLIPLDPSTGLYAYPNPFREEITIVSSQGLEKSAPLLIDESMRTYYPGFTLNASGMNIQTAGLSQGCYLLYLEEDGKRSLLGKFVRP